MAATIYDAPQELEVPKIDFANFNRLEQDKKDEKYLADLKANLASLGWTGKNAGEIIKFPVADGYAMYMVVSMRPLQLVHIPLWDAWHWQFAHLLTAKEVQQQIDGGKKLAKLFGGK